MSAKRRGYRDPTAEKAIANALKPRRQPPPTEAEKKRLRRQNGLD